MLTCFKVILCRSGGGGGGGGGEKALHVYTAQRGPPGYKTLEPSLAFGSAGIICIVHIKLASTATATKERGKKKRNTYNPKLQVHVSFIPCNVCTRYSCVNVHTYAHLHRFSDLCNVLT